MKRKKDRKQKPKKRRPLKAKFGLNAGAKKKALWLGGLSIISVPVVHAGTYDPAKDSLSGDNSWDSGDSDGDAGMDWSDYGGGGPRGESDGNADD